MPHAIATRSCTCAGSGTSAKNGAGGYFQAYGPAGRAIHQHGGRPDRPVAALQPRAGRRYYNYGPLNFYQTPNERWTAGASLNYDINSHVNVYAEVMYMRNSQLAQIAPSGDFFAQSFIPCANPLLTAQEAASDVHARPTSPRNGGAFETFNGVDYPGLNMYIGRRNVEGGNRIATFVTNSSREVLGVKGDFADCRWTYDVYAQHAHGGQQQRQPELPQQHRHRCRR